MSGAGGLNPMLIAPADGAAATMKVMVQADSVDSTK
jgi:hypothetical protein